MMLTGSLWGLPCCASLIQRHRQESTGSTRTRSTHLHTTTKRPHMHTCTNTRAHAQAQPAPHGRAKCFAEMQERRFDAVSSRAAHTMRPHQSNTYTRARDFCRHTHARAHTHTHNCEAQHNNSG